MVLVEPGSLKEPGGEGVDLRVEGLPGFGGVTEAAEGGLLLVSKVVEDAS